MVKRLEIGKPSADPAEGPPETIDIVQEYCRVTLYDLIIELRQLMREDLGVSGPDT